MTDRHGAERPFGAVSKLFYLLLFVVFLAVLTGALPTHAAVSNSDDVRPQDAASGSLFLRAAPDARFVPAPLVATDVTIAVTGMVARAAVRQQFQNTGSDWVEGIYVFPLPENSAVDHLRLHVGARVIEGHIAERAEAQREYANARTEGRRAGLVEQERPNVFTTSVANIGPGETVTVEIEYQDSPRYDRGRFELRFPLVVGPRYIPGNPLVASARGWSAPTDAVGDADRITPPVRDRFAGKGNPVTLDVTLDAGMRLAEVQSVTHKIVTAALDGQRVRVTLAEPSVPADRDFQLAWAPAVGDAPRAGLFVEHRDGQPHLLLMVMPPDRPAAEQPALPREIVFVIDTSGSMEGASIAQARSALRLALDRLTPADRFNIIRFSSDASALFRSARPADPETVAEARRFVDTLSAGGGTEMRKALDLALDGASDPRRLRQIVFLTDGLVGNEAQLLPVIASRLGDSRMFTVGIGSAPNQWFMGRAARAGRGTFTNIARIEEVQSRMAALFEKLEKPVLTDLAIAWPAGVAAEAYPDPLPDLYASEPVVAAARLPASGIPAGAVVTVSGRFAGQPWQESMVLERYADGAGVAALWARRKLERLDETANEGENRDAVRAAGLEVALGYGLISRYTSLVAVDTTPARPADGRLESAQVPVNLPEGMSAQAIFGTGGTVIGNPAANAPVALPQTATAAELERLAGSVLLLLALLMLGWRRVRRT